MSDSPNRPVRFDSLPDYYPAVDEGNVEAFQMAFTVLVGATLQSVLGSVDCSSILIAPRR